MKINYYFFKSLIFVFVLLFTSFTQSYGVGTCDSLKACLGNALTQTQTSGKSAHYVDVPSSQSLFSYSNAITIEAWLKPSRQSGKVQFVAGIWGPAEDANDVWVIYIDDNDYLTFEINNPVTKLKSNDNTKARYQISAYYDKWFHLAAVFDGQNSSASIFIDGSLVAFDINSLYRISQLKKPERADLSLQIGGSNAVSNDSEKNRTFLGQIDEFRIWHKVIQAPEIYCGKDLSFEGNEKDLILYHRYNQNPNIFTLCDASTFGNIGIARSGASCRSSNRRFNQTVFIEPPITQLIDTLKCENKKEWKFKVRDTSSCSKTVYVRVDGAGKEFFKVNPNRFNSTVRGQEYEFTLSFEGEIIGNIAPNLQVYTANRCRDWINIPLKLTRSSELSYSKDSLGFGMLKALCIETPYIDSIIRICNTTTNKSVRVTEVVSSLPSIFTVLNPIGGFTLAPGECVDVRIRFNSKDTTELYKGVLTVKSDDACNPEVKIDLVGQVQEVIGIFKTDGKTRLTSASFGTVCVDFASDAVQYIWANLLVKENIYVDSIIYPKGFTGVKFRYPVVLEPETGHLPDYFRFFPDRKGVFDDSIVFVVKSNGCTIRKSVYVKGNGYDPELEFVFPNIDFGAIPVGQTITINVEIVNKSNDQLNTSFYLKNGSGFFLTGTKSITIPPKSSRFIPLTFNPSESKKYFDEICFFEGRCYKSGCIKVEGEGYSERFSFTPEVLAIQNVIGCKSGNAKIKLKNNGNAAETLTNFFFADTSGKFKLINPIALPSSVNLNTGEELEFEFSYTPSQLFIDRVDRAFLYFKTQDNVEWNLKLLGTSQSPKLFITPETSFGQLEIGETKIMSAIIENVSPFDILVDSISVGNGFKLIYPINFNKSLKPRDTIHCKIEFAPQIETNYMEQINVYSTSPCNIEFSSKLTGKGVILPLEIPISVVSYGFIKPCDCAERKIQIINHSRVFDATIDSVYIDGYNIPNPKPELYSWSSFVMNSQGNSLPYIIKPLNRDTITIKYCPSGEFNRDSIDHGARIWINGYSQNWSLKTNVYLSGKMEIPFESDKKSITFNPTRVDTLALPQNAILKIPPIEFNQDQKDVTIDSISFYPDERVFTATINGSQVFPQFIKSLDSLTIKVDFKPRAVREYVAKMVIHYSKPCNNIDTTIVVKGSGYAPAFGLSFNIDNRKIEEDTLRFITCDTLFVPIYSSREFPANVVDINLRVGYDNNLLEFVGYESPFLFDTCKPHIPFISHKLSQFGGSDLLLKNFCRVDSVRPLIIAKYLSKTGIRDTLRLTIDSINFDTEEVILYNIVAANDFATIIKLQPEIKVANSINYDSVQVLDCKKGLISIVNIGDVPIKVDDLVNLSQHYKLVSFVPPKGSLIQVGDTCFAEVDFCPRRSDTLINVAYVISNYPCLVSDSVSLFGIGYAPEFPVKIDVSYNIDTPDTISYTIGDTVFIDLYNYRDISAIRNGITYPIMDLDFDVAFKYNHLSLKHIESKPTIGNEHDVVDSIGKVVFSYRSVDGLLKGKIAEMKFLAVVPDSTFWHFDIIADNFNSDSLLFLDLKSFPVFGFCKSDGKCSLSYLIYKDGEQNLGQNFPNPWSDFTEIHFSILEKVPVTLDLYDINGNKTASLIEESLVFEPGSYKIIINSNELKSGVYYYVINAGVFRDFKKMILVK